ncbi:MAG TPA: nuclear transport factor 2 family protein [Mucilaginibacter sp.]|nr:nuclear transport factor 2 family protein [Mucilaginibacter sp.]
MSKNLSVIACCLFLTGLFVPKSFAEICCTPKHGADTSVTDSVATRKAITGLINTVVTASGSFNIDAVADLYAPNAVIADEEPPFSWNGPTAGVQWINTVEQTCKTLRIKELKGKIGRITVYLHSDESIYVIVPATYSGEIHGDPFSEEGAFSFIFRLVSGKWLIKSQVWVTRKGM